MSGFRLGKKEYAYDPRTLKMAAFMDTEAIVAPPKFDFDYRRSPFPIRVWGNDQWGDCVLAGQCNEILRLERVEKRRTILLQDKDCVAMYKKMTGSNTPGDSRDNGLVVLYAIRDWRNNGWLIDYGWTKRNYSIEMFGELDPQNHVQLRQAIYVLHGVQLGFSLPLTAANQTRNGYWDVVENAGSSGEPGSWGGHLVYAKRYDADNIYVMTWGAEVRVSNAFMDKYCDEAWAVVDKLDTWGDSHYIDVNAMSIALHGIGASIH